MKNSIALGVVIADICEYEPFQKYAAEHGGTAGMIFGCPTVEFSLFDGEITVTCAKAGLGKVNAAMATAALISECGADMIFNSGLSGAICGVHRGEYVCGTSYVECDFDLTVLGYAPGEKPGQAYVFYGDENLIALADSIGIPGCPFGSGDFFLTLDEKKKEYYHDFGVCAFDMESAAIASVCYKTDIPFLSIRKISDDSEDSEVSDYREMNELCEADLLHTLLRLFGLLIKDDYE